MAKAHEAMQEIIDRDFDEELRNWSQKQAMTTELEGRLKDYCQHAFKTGQSISDIRFSLALMLENAQSAALFEPEEVAG